MEKVYSERQLFAALLSTILFGLALIWQLTTGRMSGARGLNINRDEEPNLFWLFITLEAIWVLFSLALACQAVYQLILHY